MFASFPPLFWISAIAAVLLIGIAKAGFGGSIGIIATPLMSLAIPIADAAALLLVLLIIIDMIMLPHYRHYFHRDNLKFMLIGALPGIFLGGVMFSVFAENEHVLRVFIGIICLAFVFIQVTGWVLSGDLSNPSVRRPFGLLFGSIAGFTSTLIHAGGPPATVFLLPQRLPKEQYVGTMALFFAAVNLIKLIPYSALGLLRPSNFLVILLLAPFCYLGARLGIFLNGRVDQVLFNRIVLVLLFLAGIQLILS